MSARISTPAQALEAAAAIADQWAEENRAAKNLAIRQGNMAMADQLDGAAIECHAIAAEIRKLAEHIGPLIPRNWREPTLEERPY